MINIVLVSHGELAFGIKNAADMVFKENSNALIISYTPKIGPTDLKNKIETKIRGLKDIIFITDIFGGCPFNIAAEIVNEEPEHRALVSGLNLSMLLEAYSGINTYHDPNELANYLIKVSKTSINKYDSSIQLEI